MSTPDFDKWPQIPMDVERFDFLYSAPWKRAVSAVLLTLAAGLLTVFDFLAFGLRIEGRENLKPLGRGGAVAVCNHVHWMDCTMMFLALWPRRQHVISLQSNLEMAGIRHILHAARCMPVPRDRKQLPRFSQAINRALREGGVVNIYPEGWLVPYCRELRAFKNGAFSQARDAGAPILPMCVTYRKGRGLWRLKRRPCMTLHILPPVFPDMEAPRGPETVRLREACRAAMEACIAEHAPAAPKEPQASGTR